VIYDTNLFSSYAAGRYEQMQAVKADRPYWRYRHSDAVVHPRPVHVAWNRKVLHADDPWWQTAYPPNGFGCKCFVETLSARDLARMGIPKPPMNRVESMPFAGQTQTVKDRQGHVHTTPKGIDRGWDYAPGKSVSADLARLKAMAQDKLKRLGLAGEVVATLPLSTTRDSPLKAVNLKDLPLVPLAGRNEVDESLRRLAVNQPDWFPFGYQGLSIVDGGETLFAAVEEGQLYLSNADALIPGYRPAESFRSALQKIKAGEPLAFREEYAVETVWHEMMHERTSVVAARRIIGQEPLEEGMIQLAARSTYDRLLMALGSAPPSHQADILENGLAYPSVTRNLLELTRRAGISGEEIERLLLQYRQQWLEPFKKQLAEGLNTKRASSLLGQATIKPLADFRERIDVQIRNAPLRNKE